MDSFDVNEYSEKSREVLIKVLEEIQEQFLINNKSSQFWFYLNRMEDKSLTEFIVEKWLQALANKGILHYYKPNYSEWEEAVVFSHKRLEEKYEWNPQMTTSYILNRSPDPHSRPSFAIDVCNTDLDKLIDSLKRNTVWGKFSVDKLGRLYYDCILLNDINNSSEKRAILGEFLLADKHTVSASRVEELIVKDSDEGTETNKRRNRLISEIGKELRKASHDINIDSYKVGHKVDYYELIVTNKSV